MTNLVRVARRLSDFGEAEHRWLLAVACEDQLPKSALMSVMEQLGKGASPQMLQDFVTRAVEADLLIHVGLVHSPLPRRPGEAREPCYAVPADARQVVLRRGASRNDLEVVAGACRAALGERSDSALALLIQSGDFSGLQTFVDLRAKNPGLGRGSDQQSDETRIRDAVEEAFDPEWLKATFGDQAISFCAWILARALPRLDPCPHIYDWTSQAVETMRGDDDEFDPQVLSVLCQHALMRNLPAVAEKTALGLPIALRSAFQAASSYIRGDSEAAFQLVRAPISPVSRRGRGDRFEFASLRLSAKGSTSAAGAVLPLLALMLCSTDKEQDLVDAKRLLNARGSGDELGGAARAFRTLVRYSTNSEATYARIDAHQLPVAVSAWEVLILGLTVVLYQDQETTRAAWTKLLLDKGLSYCEAGYEWAGRQALFLSQALDERLFELEFAQARPGQEPPVCRTGELLLRDLIQPKSDWEKTLESLARVVEQAEGAEERTYRVAWYINLAERELRRPSLEEFRPERGWSSGRRVTLDALFEVKSDLPPEDVRVLRCTVEDAEHNRQFLPEAWEALVGHPRVFNGIRGPEPINVIPGQCRVTANEVGGYLHIETEPRDAEPGINVRVPDENTVVVYRVGQAMHRVMATLPSGLRVPPRQQKKALGVLGKLSQIVEVKSPLLGQERTVESNATPCLRISPHAGAWLVQAGVRPFGKDGQFFIAGTGRRAHAAFVDGVKLRTDRDFDRERVMLSLLVAECPTLLEGLFDEDAVLGPGDPRQTWTLGHEGVLILLSELREVSTPFEIEWPESRALKLRAAKTQGDLKVSLRRKKGWYLATGGLRIDDVNEVTLSELLVLPSLAGGRFVQLPSGDFIELEDRVRRVMDGFLQSSTPGRSGTRAKIHESALHTLAMLEEEAFVEWDDEGKDWLERARRVREQEFPIPQGLTAQLRPYQVEGFQFLARLTELGLGACLADDMGLGKTVQILTLLLMRSSDGPAIVVAPTSVCSNWQTEISRFAPELVAHDYSGPDRHDILERVKKGAEPNVLICSYTLLQQDIDRLAEISFGTAVLDEAQFIKNPTSLRARAAFRLQAQHRIVSTGTPVENHLGDLWSLFHFMNPPLLGPQRAYQRQFVKPIQRDNDAAAKNELRRAVQPYILRRLKSQVLKELPPLTTIRHEVRLSPDEATRYALLRRQIHDKLHTGHGKRQNKLEILAEIMRLRRFCCHPRLVFPDAGHECSKVDAFLELATELIDGEHRALVFSQFTDFLGLVRERLEQRGIRYEYLDGSTPRAQRKERVDAFQAGSTPLFLISLKAGGFGLNLTGADYVIHLDPWWNPAVEAQATDRAHRIGQERPVTVYRLVTKETIEESILELHEEKRRLAQGLLDGADGEVMGDLDPEELLELLAPMRP